MFLYNQVHCCESRGEEEVTHELRLDGEAGRVRKAKRAVGAAGTHESSFARETDKGVEDALNEAKNANEDTRN